MVDESKISRRNILIAAAGVATGAATIVTVAPAHAKAPQKAVKIRTRRRAIRRVKTALFEAPSSCKTVDGTISPQGWCMVYAKKPA